MSQPSQEVLFHARCELEAMLVANVERARQNQDPMYDADAFYRLAEETRGLFRNTMGYDEP